MSPKRVIVHLRSQAGQPYGSERKCCNRCGTALLGAEPKWVEYEDDYNNLPEEYVRCMDANAPPKDKPMPIIDVRTEGDLFDCGADVIVIPVNCVGAAGKGLAKQFSQLAPQAADQYRQLCRGAWLPGSVHVVAATDRLAKKNIRQVVLFPTKNHWRHPSQLSWIEQGLDDMVRLFDVAESELKLNVLAVPALGCGEGGLDWTEVEPLMLEKMRRLYVASRVIVFAPRGL